MHRAACWTCLAYLVASVAALQPAHLGVLKRQDLALALADAECNAGDCELVEKLFSINPTTYKTNTKTRINSKTRTIAGAGPTKTAHPTTTKRPVATTTTAAQTVSGTGWLAKPTSFVKRSGTRLTLDGETYRPVGFNAYWLGLDENVNPSPSYPAKSRVREIFAMAVAMGANTVRCHTCGISTGNSLSLQTDAYSFNNDAFASIDYAIYAAREYGIRLVIPLTDQYHWYHGGLYDFLGWAGDSTSSSYTFYTSSGARALWKTYIKTLLQHKNQYTGVRLCDSPEILAWETGNEFGAYMLQSGAPPYEFTNDIANYIKSLAPSQLVMDGSDGITSGSGEEIQGLEVPNIDLVSDHLYPINTNLASSDLSIANSHSKAMFWGEWNWNDNNVGAFLSQLEQAPYAGATFWSMMSHTGDCSGWVTHNDGYSMYYGTGTGQSNQLAVAQSFHRLTKRGPPRQLNVVACPQPPLDKGGS